MHGLSVLDSRQIGKSSGRLLPRCSLLRAVSYRSSFSPACVSRHQFTRLSIYLTWPGTGRRHAEIGFDGFPRYCSHARIFARFFLFPSLSLFRRFRFAGTRRMDYAAESLKIQIERNGFFTRARTEFRVVDATPTREERNYYADRKSVYGLTVRKRPR